MIYFKDKQHFLMLLIFLAIKIGGGPAIYKQERIGLEGKPFYIYKFRSMLIDAEKEGEELLQQENDPRPTSDEDWKDSACSPS